MTKHHDEKEVIEEQGNTVRNAEADVNQSNNEQKDLDNDDIGNENSDCIGNENNDRTMKIEKQNESSAKMMANMLMNNFYEQSSQKIDIETQCNNDLLSDEQSDKSEDVCGIYNCFSYKDRLLSGIEHRHEHFLNFYNYAGPMLSQMFNISIVNIEDKLVKMQFKYPAIRADVYLESVLKLLEKREITNNNCTQVLKLNIQQFVYHYINTYRFVERTPAHLYKSAIEDMLESFSYIYNNNSGSNLVFNSNTYIKSKSNVGSDIDYNSFVFIFDITKATQDENLKIIGLDCVVITENRLVEDKECRENKQQLLAKLKEESNMRRNFYG